MPDSQPIVQMAADPDFAKMPVTEQRNALAAHDPSFGQAMQLYAKAKTWQRFGSNAWQFAQQTFLSPATARTALLGGGTV